MLYYDFAGLEGFEARFGIVRHGNGEKSRKNKILLAYVKQPSLFKEAARTGDYSLINISCMSELKQTMLTRIFESGQNLPNEVRLINYTFHSAKFSTDEYNGLCEDGDPRSCRYINHSNGNRIFKMRAGKFIRSLILETDFGQTLPEQVLVWLCEEFTQEWQTFTLSTFPENQLFVNDSFEDIYSSRRCVGNFHSCMTDQGNHYYYQDAVKAKAAYLQNTEGKIIARCVIFTEVYEEGSDKIWRLAERQYSTDCNDILKRALVDALIRGGHIDGYKKVGAGCSDTREFVDINGNSLADKKFYIDCDLDLDDTLSYQDSFRYYKYSAGLAYNYSNCGYSYCLDTTDGSLNGDNEEEDAYDDYHEYYCEEVRAVYYKGQVYYCDVNNLDDFRYVESLDQYHYYEDVICCDECGSNELEDNAVYSMITEEYYCCEECKEKAEKKYKERNWYFSDFDNSYYPNGEDITTFNRWDRNMKQYVPATIAIDSLDENLKSGVISEVKGNYYFTTELTKTGKLRKEAHHEAA